MAIKSSCGELPLPASLDAFVEIEFSISGYQSMPIHRTHVMRTFGLPFIHRDPFDRLLVAQALVAGLTLVSRDPAITSYPIETLW